MFRKISSRRKDWFEALPSARAAAKDPALADLVRREEDLSKQVNAELGALNNVLAIPSSERDEKGVQQIVLLLLLFGLLIPMNWGAPQGSAIVLRNAVSIVPDVAGEVIEVPSAPTRAGRRFGAQERLVLEYQSFMPEMARHGR